MPRKKGSQDKKPRKKRGGSKDGAQPAQPAHGHNSGELTDQQQRALFMQNLGKIEKAKETVDGAMSVLRHAYKTAKSDGITKKDIDFAISLRKNDDQEMIGQHKRQLQIARWLVHPIGTQPDLFQDHAGSANKYYELGMNAGIENRPLKPPYDSGEPYQEWILGWHAGQKVNQSVLQENMERNIEKQAAEDAAKPQSEAFSDALPDKGEEGGEDEGGEGDDASTQPADPPGPLSQQVANAKAQGNGGQE